MSVTSLIALMGRFPNEEAACAWLEERMWPFGERHCPRCGCVGRVQGVRSKKPMPYRCSECRQYFSLRTGTLMEGSYIPLHKWLVAIYLLMEGSKGISSVKLGEWLGLQQKSAWYLAHRIREAMDGELAEFAGPVEMDETYIGGKEKNKHFCKRLRPRGGHSGKETVIGVKDRATNRVKAEHVPASNADQAVRVYVESVEWGAKVYTDESKIYSPVPNRSSVNHERHQYVCGIDTHTNGIESFWALVKRGYHGVYHWMSPKHLQRYVDEFCGRYNSRGLDTLERIGAVFDRMRGKRLTYKQLVG